MTRRYQPIALAHGKEYPAPFFSDVEAEEFHLLGLMPWFDIQELEEDGFVYLYAVNGWLPGDIPL